MFETPVILAILATFLLAGTVKGVIGLGLPTVSLALLTVATDLTSAMALLLVPSFVTNLWQALVGGHFVAALRRTWPFLAAATLTIWLGGLALTRVDLALLSALLGALLVVYATLSLAGLRLAVPPAREAWLGPLAGAANGILTGMTGSFVVPGVLYLQGLGLGRDALIQAMGLLFTLSTLTLAAALGGSGLLSPDLGLWSAAAVAPALIGMTLGQKVRRALPEARFRRVFFAALLLLGAYIVAGALGVVS
jgi:uncharacterized membrane protein YfcA